MDVAKKQLKRDDKEKNGELIEVFTGLNRNISFSFSDGYESNIEDNANDIAYNNSKVVNGIIRTIYEKEENDDIAYSQLNSSIKAADLKQIAADYDLIGCNLFEGNLKILKGNSSEIYIKSARDVIKVNASQKREDSRYIERQLHDNDMLILVSSGVVQTNIDNPDWIKTLLKDIHTDVSNARILVIHILQFMKVQNGGVINSQGDYIIKPEWNEMVLIPNDTQSVFIVQTDVNIDNKTFTSYAIDEKRK